MHAGKLVFAQLTENLSLTTFRRCVARYDGELKIKHFTCLEQFLCQAFAQFTYRESLRDIEACLRAHRKKLYVGIRSRIWRGTLADANEVRDWRIYADFAQRLIGMVRELYAEDSFGADLKETVYALDTTTIDLCLSVFPWAPFRRARAALPEPGAFYIVDRGFLDFERLFRFHEADSFFVMLGKTNVQVQRRHSHPVDRTTR